MIRPAKTKEFQILTTISFSSKGYWGYPTEYFDIWKDELTITPKYIEKNTVNVYEINDKIFGYYSIVEIKENLEVSGSVIHKGFWLEHMFFITKTYWPGNRGKTVYSHL